MTGSNEARSAKRIAEYGFDFFTGKELEEMDLPDPVWIVEDILPLGGAAMLAAPPKRKKSFLAQDLCISVGLNRPFLGRQTCKGKALYLALEDKEPRLRRRQRPMLCGAEDTHEWQYAITAPKIDDGLIDSIRKWKSRVPDCVLIVIDIFQRVRPAEKVNDYALDYASVSVLNDIANELSITILLVHHTRKAESADDVFADISGSNGIYGALTTVWMLKSKGEEDNDATLYFQGKDVEAGSAKIRFNRTNLRFEPTIDVASLKRESPNALVRVASRLLERHGGQWQGTAAGFQDFALSQPEYRGTERTPSSFGRELAGDAFRQAALVERIGITKTKGRIRLFWYEGAGTL